MKSSQTSEQTDPRVLRLSPQDNVGVATESIEAGESVLIDGRPVEIRVRVPTGHKLALDTIVAGEKVLKYGEPIGSTTCEIRPGEHVHTHNIESDYLPTYGRGASGQ